MTKCSVKVSCAGGVCLKTNREEGQEMRMMRLLLLAETRCNLGNAMQAVTRVLPLQCTANAAAIPSSSV